MFLLMEGLTFDLWKTAESAKQKKARCAGTAVLEETLPFPGVYIAQLSDTHQNSAFQLPNFYTFMLKSSPCHFSLQ